MSSHQLPVRFTSQITTCSTIVREFITGRRGRPLVIGEFVRNRLGLFVIFATLLSLWVAAPTSTSALPLGACGGRAYITGKSGNEMMIVDTISDSVITTLTAASNGLDVPVGFRISPDGNFGYLANNGNDEVLKIDLETNATVAS